MLKQLSIPQRTAQDHSKDLAEALLECERLRAENAKLRASLVEHGISATPDVAAPGTLEQAVTEPDTSLDSTTSNSLTPAEKVALFRRLFRGRIDGKTRLVYLVTPGPAAMNGEPACVTNPRSNAPTVTTGCYRR
jgi:hypothetical protein